MLHDYAPLTAMPLSLFLQIIMVAIGITYVITGSVIGFRLRLIWCTLFQWQPLRPLWYLVRCPPCNAWWTGAATAFLFGAPFTSILQMAFTTCGVVALIQARLGGNGIAADEDMEELVGDIYGK